MLEGLGCFGHFGDSLLLLVKGTVGGHGMSTVRRSDLPAGSVLRRERSPQKMHSRFRQRGVREGSARVQHLRQNAESILCGD